jgi:hypothetical protein
MNIACGIVTWRRRLLLLLQELTPDPNRQRSNLIERRKAEKSLTEQLNMANERRKRAAPSTEVGSLLQHSMWQHHLLVLVFQSH